MLDDVRIIAEQSNAINVQLEIGAANETVTVTNAAPLVDTATANISGTVTAQQLQTLPSMGRDPFQLLQLAPGAFGDGARSTGGGTQNLPGTTIGGTRTSTGSSRPRMADRLSPTVRGRARTTTRSTASA